MRRDELVRLLRKPYLNPRETAKMLNKPTRWVYYWLTLGRLPGCKLGGVWIVSNKRLNEMVSKGLQQRVNDIRYVAQIDRRMREKHLVVPAARSKKH